jgi:hypothetical protein
MECSRTVMLKSHILIFSLSTMSFNATHCMLSNFKYNPLTIICNDEITEKRDTIAEWIMHPRRSYNNNFIANVQIIKKATDQEAEWTCFGYAIYKATGSTVPLNMWKNKNYKKTTIDIEKFFEQTESPQKNGIVIYSIYHHYREIKHFAYIITSTIFESKCGKSRNIIHHALFDLPNTYGNIASFWTLREEYVHSQEMLLETIKNDADLFNPQLDSDDY